MKRRLYFLLQDASHAAVVVKELELQGIDRRQIHITSSQGIDAGVPLRPALRSGDMAARIRTALRLANLAAFCMALLLLIVMLLLQSGWFWMLLPVGIMLISFLAGLGFSSRVPTVKPDRPGDTPRHGEVLLKVDVPAQQAVRVEAMVHRRHPDVAVGGAGWSRDHLPV